MHHRPPELLGKGQHNMGFLAAPNEQKKNSRMCLPEKDADSAAPRGKWVLSVDVAWIRASTRLDGPKYSVRFRTIPAAWRMACMRICEEQTYAITLQQLAFVATRPTSIVHTTHRPV